MSDRLRTAQIRLNAELRRCDARDGREPHPGGNRFQRSWIGRTITEHAEFKIALYKWLEQEQEENYLASPRKVKL